jgi:hypothetical protein
VTYLAPVWTYLAPGVAVATLLYLARAAMPHWFASHSTVKRKWGVRAVFGLSFIACWIGNPHENLGDVLLLALGTTSVLCSPITLQPSPVVPAEEKKVEKALKESRPQ